MAGSKRMFQFNHGAVVFVLTAHCRLQVNVLSALLVPVLLIPAAKRASAARPGSKPRLVIVGSDVHYWAIMPKKVIHAPSGKVLSEFNKRENWLKGTTTQPRYYQSKRAPHSVLNT